MIKPVNNPGPKGAEVEEFAALAEGVELWVSIEEARTDELIKDAECKRWHDGKDDVVEC
jgi:hypothetical protein